MTSLIIVLIGLPASGKSVFARNLSQDANYLSIFKKIHIVDPDIIRKEIMGATFQFEQENSVQLKKTEILQKLMTDAAEISTLIILDDLNYFSSMRHEIFILAKKHDIQYLSIYFEVGLDFCLNNNENRGLPVPNSVIEKINQKFDIPGDKYHWDIPFMKFNPFQDDSTLINNEILLKIKDELREKKISGKNVVKPLKSFSPAQSSTINHELDNQVRKLFHQLLSSSDEDLFFQVVQKIQALNIKSNQNTALSGKDLHLIKKDFIKWLKNHSYSEPTRKNFLDFLTSKNDHIN